MKIGIAPRPDLQDSIELADKIASHFSSEQIFISPETAEKLGKKGTPVNEMDVEALVTIGGDGTVLRNLQKSPDTPILGINMGGRGFLADVNPQESIEAIEELIKGNLKLFERERIAVKISGELLGEGLNEGVVKSRDPGRILSFKVELDEEEVEKTGGDGLIVSSQTGSTAYGMSAGGPIIDPNVEAFVAVPLCTLRPRTLPLVFPTSSSLKVEILDCGKKADVTVDGQLTGDAGEGDTITFEKSDNSAKFYKWRGKFYEKLREKL